MVIFAIRRMCMDRSRNVAPDGLRLRPFDSESFLNNDAGAPLTLNPDPPDWA